MMMMIIIIIMIIIPPHFLLHLTFLFLAASLSDRLFSLSLSLSLVPSLLERTAENVFRL
jgi:hypothetical protein